MSRAPSLKAGRPRYFWDDPHKYRIGIGSTYFARPTRILAAVISMGSLKTKFRKLWYIGLGAALALVPAMTTLADGGGSSSE